jgi:hypothetical protein
MSLSKNLLPLALTNQDVAGKWHQKQNNTQKKN